MRGLEQARAGQVSESPPDLDADQELANEDIEAAHKALKRGKSRSWADVKRDLKLGDTT